MKQTKLWLTTIAALLCSLTASAYDFSVGGIYYDITDATNLTLEVTNSYYNEYSGAVIIPSTVTYNSKTYRVTSIGDYAFDDCSNLTSITIPEGVTRIGLWAFYNCSRLTSITIPEGVTSIRSSAFGGCSSLTAITIPASATSIDDNAFSDCINLTSIIVEEANSRYDSRNDCNAIIITSSNTLITGCSTTVIPEGVTSIGDRAFYGCSSLTSITIPKGVTSIGNNAFCNCSSLTSITIPEGVTSIGYYAFDGCTGLTSITIPESVTSIGNDAFRTCSSLTSITIPKGVTSIELETFAGCSSLTSITISKGVTSIGFSAFYGCSSLTTITIPEGVTSIGSSAFYNCNRLTSITIPEGVTSIGSSAFYNCNRLTSITIPESVTSIGNSVFYNCNRLTTINIPKGLSRIGDDAFYGCSSLASITCEAETPPIISGPNTFYKVDKSIPVYVPAGSVPVYQSAVFWKVFANIQPIANLLTYMLDGKVILVETVNYGEKIDLLEEPTKEGYTFSGWSEAPETMPANDVTISGTFTVNIYKVYYYVGEELVYTAEVAYGEAIPEYIYEPTKEGDVFEGWVGDTYETMPAHDVTYTANIESGIEDTEFKIQNSFTTSWAVR